MITTLTEFEESSAFERSALAAVYPLLGINISRPLIDLRDPTSAQIHVFVGENFRQAARAELIDQLRPLLFGAAWKTLDLLFELAFHQASLVPKKGLSRWYISEKERHARANLGTLAPISRDSDIWSRLCALYANTVEARHCLTHRSFLLNSDGNMTNLRAPNGTAQPDVTSSEQQAFCRVSLGAAHAVLSSQFTYRDRSDLVSWLDQLTNHHRLGVLGGGGLAQPAPIVRVNAKLAAQSWTVDLAQARAGGSTTFQQAPYFDIEIHFPGTGLPPVTGHLEEAPSDPKVVIDPVTLPQWLHP